MMTPVQRDTMRLIATSEACGLECVRLLGPLGLQYVDQDDEYTYFGEDHARRRWMVCRRGGSITELQAPPPAPSERDSVTFWLDEIHVTHRDELTEGDASPWKFCDHLVVHPDKGVVACFAEEADANRYRMILTALEYAPYARSEP